MSKNLRNTVSTLVLSLGLSSDITKADSPWSDEGIKGIHQVISSKENVYTPMPFYKDPNFGLALALGAAGGLASFYLLNRRPNTRDNPTYV